ncbi:hypothetical protein INS49_002650 [Diaporthe citri]|uniref:uncharacterized protein n=1 Tax=Diaporthe citri TaxID=83186 RepID=UPI001C818D28|nr:uncharacterized protein INS49_002650 [Diaporthe citri]KAG6368443.1 hypothetical protein INS49_002650 [Diaporthe citri]
MHPKGVYCFRGDNDDEDGGTQETDRNPNHPFLWKQLLDAPDRRHSCDPYEQLFTDWNMLTKYYASRELTVPNDNLVALSGLANNMKARLQQLRPGPHRYLAGLWEETLIDTLVWNVRAPARRALKYRAPSWSWACLDGYLNLIGCKHGDMISFTSMVSVEMRYLGKEGTGEVDGGILTLAGPCALAKIDMEKRSHQWFENEKDVRIIQGDDGSNLYEKDETKVKVYFDALHDLTDDALLIWVCAHHFHDEKWFGHDLVLARVEEDKHHGLGMASCQFDDKEDARAFSARFSQKQIKII